MLCYGYLFYWEDKDVGVLYGLVRVDGGGRERRYIPCQINFVMLSFFQMSQQCYRKTYVDFIQ